MAPKNKAVPVVEVLLSRMDELEQKLKNGAPMEQIANGLADAVGYGDSGIQQGNPWTEQISSTTTLFKNMRWYLVSNFRQMLSEAYVEFGLIQTIVDVPVDDGLRGGIEVKSKQLSEQQIDELQVSIERDDDLVTLGQAAKWNRLFGGAGIIAMTDQDPMEPLDMDAIGPDTPLEFRAVDLWELFWDVQNTGGYDPSLGQEDFEYYTYYGEKVHKSRVMRMIGKNAPSFIRPRLRGWGFSVVEALVRSINQYLKATDLGFEVLDEFKLDVYKIKNLTATLLQVGGTEKVRKRIQLANYMKNYQHATIMDSEDDFDHKQLSFAGLGDAMAGIRMQVASDMRMPLTKLFGISAAGFNSGEDDIEVYNSMVEGDVRGKLKKPALRICEFKCQKLFGFVPDDLAVGFKPLRVLSAEQEETVKTQKFTRLFQAKQAGEITTLEFRNACNKDNLLEITLDTDDAAIGEIEDMADEAAELEAGADGAAAKGEGGAKNGKTIPGTRGGKVTREGKDLPPNAPKAREAPTKPAKDATKVAKPDKDAKPAPKVKNLRPLDPSLYENSAAFTKASYEADGGDAWVDARRSHFFAEGIPVGADGAKWAKAQQEAKEAGLPQWQAVLWLYQKAGGRFSA